MTEELERMEADRDRWREIALYLANCHAATAESDGQLSKTSAYSKRRLASICNHAADALDGKMPENSQSDLAYVRDRCRNIAGKLLGKEGGSDGTNT